MKGFNQVYKFTTASTLLLCAATIVALSSLSNAQTLASGTTTASTSTSVSSSDVNPAGLSDLQHYLQICDQSETNFLLGNWAVAHAGYSMAIALEPTYPQAKYGLAECAAQKRLFSIAAHYYSSVIYDSDGKIVETNVQRLMNYSVVLLRIGDTKRALEVYNAGAAIIDRDQSNFAGFVPLPEFTSNQSAPAFTTLASLAYTAAGIYLYNDPSNCDYLARATAAEPTNPIASYYLGVELARTSGKDEAAVEAFAVAKRYGNAVLSAAVDKAISNGSPRLAELAKGKL